MSQGWDGHLLLLHESEEERRSGFAAWVRQGFELRERVVCLDVDGTWVSPTLVSALWGHGINADAVRQARRVLGIPLAGFQSPESRAGVVQEALAEGYRGVRLIVDASAALRVLPGEGYGDIDRAIDRLCETHPVSALCHYDSTTDAATGLDDVAAPHVAGRIRDRQLFVTRDDDGLCLIGEVDVNNHRLLAATLRASTTGSEAGQATFRLDLSSLAFLSVGGARALAEGTRQYREKGGRVLLTRPPRVVERVLRTLGVDLMPGMELVGGSL